MGEKPEIEIPSVPDMIQQIKHFVKDASYFATKCKKPNKQEWILQVRLIGMAFATIGFVGFFVKLMAIPFTRFLLKS